MGAYVPEALKRWKNWILWRKEDGQKVPYSASMNYNGKTGTSLKYAHQWTDYTTAETKLASTGEEYNGLGFVFTRSCGMTFIDLDHCIDEDGEPNAFAGEIIDMFAGSYMEYSQSETGLHIVCCGKIPTTRRNSRIELYNNGQYMAFTGNAYEAKEPQYAQRQLNELYARFPEKQSNEYTAAFEQIEQQPQRTEDETVLSMAKRGRNGEQFMRLYSGEWMSQYSSHSEADMRLIALLWYYSRNAEQVERLFLASGLADRDKARRTDYIRNTIAKAAQNTPAAKRGSTRQKESSFMDQPQRKRWKAF